ncbi:MAG: DUF309 domain-containing protein [Acidobacteria bacterium]|nr:DUF309 domain-containing protein [Acidobacteriota bacterium]
MPRTTAYNTDGYRYTNEPFPRYRHVPGKTPHPRMHPRGHQFEKPETSPEPFDPANWRDSRDYLYGVDLYNFSYFWEAHEAWEGLWKTTQRNDPPGLFLQGLIQISAALLKRKQGLRRGMGNLGGRGLAKLRAVSQIQPIYCGVNLKDYVQRMEQIFAESDLGHWPADPRLRLTGIEPDGLAPSRLMARDT